MNTTLNPKILVPLGIGAAIGYVAGDPKTKQTLDYGKYLAKHKYHVIKPMRSMGLGWGQALKHDLSKLTPTEFGPYRDWFAGPKGIKGTRDPELYAKWRESVQHHYHSPGNMHHYRALGIKQSKVPLKYRLEAVADWYSVGRSRGITSESFPEWYGRLKDKLPISPDTKNTIDTRIGLKKEAIAHELTMAIQTVMNHPKVISTIQRIKNVPFLQKALAKTKELDEVGKRTHPNLRRGALAAQVAGNIATFALPTPYNLIPFGKATAGTYLAASAYSKAYITNPKFQRFANSVIGALPK